MDLYAPDSTRWAYDLMVGTGVAALVAAVAREIFERWRGRGR